jgi:hypothetical protein
MSSYSEPVLIAKTEVHTPLPQAKQWFFELGDHPERYEFESHQGFTFTQGDFGEIGAEFKTEERFMGVSQTLKFVLTDVGEQHFTFKLKQPLSDIWGRFVLSESPSSATELRLEIGGTNAFKRLLLRMPLLSQAIRSQIQSEVEHIKASIENTNG